MADTLRERIARELFDYDEAQREQNAVAGGARSTLGPDEWDDAPEFHGEYFERADLVLALLDREPRDEAIEQIATSPLNDLQPKADSICPVCGTHFGYDDFALTHAELRAPLLRRARLEALEDAARLVVEEQAAFIETERHDAAATAYHLALCIRRLAETPTQEG